jgi:hypothetical protein
VYDLFLTSPSVYRETLRDIGQTTCCLLVRNLRRSCVLGVAMLYPVPRPDNFEAALAVSMLVVTCAIVATVFLLSYSR